MSNRNGAEAIAAERQRQIDVEGYTPEHDAGHQLHHLTAAATAYLLTGADPGLRGSRITSDLRARRTWPWEQDGFKPDFGRRDLVRAGALIAAAIDALDDEPRPDMDADRFVLGGDPDDNAHTLEAARRAAKVREQAGPDEATL